MGNHYPFSFSINSACFLISGIVFVAYWLSSYLFCYYYSLQISSFMKKICTLLSVLLFATAASAQQAHKGVIFQQGSAATNQPAGSTTTTATGNNLVAAKEGHKTTSWPGPGGDRWYDYGGSTLPEGGVLTNIGLPSLAIDSICLWNDTTAIFGYTGSTPTYRNNDAITSLGMGFDPRYAIWNDDGNFPFKIAVSDYDAYVIDSIRIVAKYNRNLAKPSVVDTIVITFVQSDTTSAATMPPMHLIDTFRSPDTGLVAGAHNFLGLGHDSLNNRAGNISGTTVLPVPSTQVYKFPLTLIDTNNAHPTSGMTFPRGAGHPFEPIINFPVLAGNYAAATVTFISGDTWPSSYLPSGYKDTIRYSNDTAATGYKYGSLNMMVDYVGTTTTPCFPPYNWDGGDHTSGYYKKEGAGMPGWGGLYVTDFRVGYHAAASKLQYPTILFHISCITCNLTGNRALSTNDQPISNHIQITPNPANDELNITLTDHTPATITLTNMLGQVVATQNVTNGHTTINIAALPASMYVYTLSANGGRTTGRVVVAH